MESGTEHIDLATITDRMAVMKDVQSGNVEDAIEKVSDLNPEVSCFFCFVIAFSSPCILIKCNNFNLVF
ncbi:hypothetical protein HanIR_Chr11g0529901 [Helianthus annuus]|nr:hypothetical protein HanIR_Chr11g0529901 [Helianthus annuus]